MPSRARSSGPSPIRPAAPATSPVRWGPRPSGNASRRRCAPRDLGNRFHETNRCRVGKIAWHCDHDCAASRNFAHARFSRGPAAWATRRYAVLRYSRLRRWRVAHPTRSPVLKPVGSAANDRPAAAEGDLLVGPGPARRAAAQRIDRHLDLVAGFEALARPAVADQEARARAFEVPDRCAAVIAPHFQDDEGMRAAEFELLHRAPQLQRVLDIEDRKGMMGKRAIARRQHGAAHQHCSQLRAHAFLLPGRGFGIQPAVTGAASQIIPVST